MTNMGKASAISRRLVYIGLDRWKVSRGCGFAKRRVPSPMVVPLQDSGTGHSEPGAVTKSMSSSTRPSNSGSRSE